MKLTTRIRQSLLWRAVCGRTQERRRCVLMLSSVSLPMLYIMLLGGLLGLATLQATDSSRPWAEDSTAIGAVIVTEARLCGSLQALRSSLGKSPREELRALTTVQVHPRAFDPSFSNGTPPRWRLRLLRVIQI
jgi:hypothetical protein